MNKEAESGHLNTPNIQMGRAYVFIKLCLQLERANEHLALEHAISFSSTVTPPPKQTIASTIHTLYYFAAANCGGGV